VIDPTRVESSLAKLSRIRMGIRPWQVLLLISGIGVATLGIVSLTLKAQSEEATVYVRQMVATHQIQQGATDLLLNIEGASAWRGSPQNKPILNRVNRIAECLLVGGQVGQTEIVALQHPAHQDSMRILINSLDEFTRLCAPILNSNEETAIRESADALLYASFERVVNQARALHGEIRAELGALDVQFKRLQWTMIILAAVLFFTLAILLSERVRERIGLKLRVRQTLERYDAMFERSPLGYQSLDSDGNLISVNSAWVEILGYSREEVLGTWMGDYLQPQAIEHFKRKFPQFKAEGEISGVEMPMFRQDGTPIIASFDGKIETDKQGRFVQTHCVMKDITDQVDAKSTLQLREKQQAVMAKLGQEALGCDDLGELFDMAIAVVSETLQLSFCHILELMPDGCTVKLQAGVGWDEDLRPQSSLSVSKNSMVDYALQISEPLFSTDLEADTRFTRPSFLIKRGLKSSVCSIIGTPDNALGVLSAHSQVRREFNPDEISFVHSVANLLAVAMIRFKREAKIRQSEDELKSLFENTPIGIVKQDMSELFTFFDELKAKAVTDFRTYFNENIEEVRRSAGMVKMLDANQAALDIHDTDNKMDLIVTLDKLMTDKALELYIDELVLLAQGVREFVHPSEVRSVAGDVKFVFLKLTMDPAFPDGSLVYIYVLDMSDLHQAERALGYSESLLGTLFDNAEDCIFVKNSAGHYTLINKAMVKLFQRPMEDIVGKGDVELFGEEAAQKIRESDLRVLAGETVYTMDPEPVGDKIYRFNVVKVPMRNAEGEVTGIFGIARDVTEEVQAAEALAKSEARIRALVNAADDIIFMKDKARRYTVTNPAFANRIGLLEKEILGKTLKELHLKEDHSEVEELEERVLAGEIVRSSHEYTIDGKWICFSVVRVPVRNEQGEIEGLCGVSRDITEMVSASQALSESEARFRTMIETADDIIFMKDLDRRFTIVNHACENHLDKLASEILSKTLAELRDAPSGDSAQDPVSNYVDEIDKRVLAGETVRKMEENVSEHGHKYIDVLKSPMRDKEGNITGICGIARDVTEKMEAAAALTRSESQLRTLIETAQDIIFIKDLDRRYTMVNPAMCNLEGKAPEDILGKNNMEAFGSKADEFLDSIDLRILAGETLVMEYENDAQGEKRTFNVMRAPMRGPDGEINGLVGIARDVTDYHKVKEEILRLATAIEQAGDVVVVTDREGIIHYVNPAFEATTGYSRAEVLGANPSILKSGAHDETFYKKMWGTILEGETWEGRLINKRKDGSLYQENATISAVYDREGEIVNFVAVKHDITRQIELEEQIHHAHRMESVGHLAGGLAHDFNNILQSMTGFLEFAQDGLDPEDPRSKDLDEVRKGAARATKLTRELLTFSRMREVNLEPMDLRSIIHQSLGRLRPMLGEDIYLEFREADEPMMAMIDSILMDRAISNLCINACDAMSEGGDLTIEIEHLKVDKEFAAMHTELSEGPHVCFCITDSGSGISKDMLGHIFDPFYSTKDVGEGTGLGLAVVHGIVKQHSGLIEVESEIWKGTRFRVILPEADEGVVNEENLEDTQRQQRPMAKG
jgi:PAS domain S-box-containing protein